VLSDRQLRAASVLALLGLSQPAAATAEDAFYAGKTLRLIVGLPVGGGADAYARLVQRYLARHVPGTPSVVVQNLPGAGSLKSVTFLDSGAPDGTTMVTFSAGLVTEALTAPERIKVDFRHYGFIGSASEDIRVCYVRSAIGVRDWQDLLARDDVIFGASAPGAAGTADIAMLRNLFGARIRQVQGYAGSAAKRLAIEKGEIDGECGGFTSVPTTGCTTTRSPSSFGCCGRSSPGSIRASPLPAISSRMTATARSTISLLRRESSAACSWSPGAYRPTAWLSCARRSMQRSPTPLFSTRRRSFGSWSHR